MKTCMYQDRFKRYRVAEDVCDYYCQRKTVRIGGFCNQRDECECKVEDDKVEFKKVPINFEEEGIYENIHHIMGE